MPGQLITLPFRLGVRSAQLVLHTAEQVAGRALETTVRAAVALNSLRSGHHDGHDERRSWSEDAARSAPTSPAARSTAAQTPPPVVARGSRETAGTTASSRAAARRSSAANGAPTRSRGAAGERGPGAGGGSGAPSRTRGGSGTARARRPAKPAPQAPPPEPDPRIAERAEADRLPEPPPPESAPADERGAEVHELASERLRRQGVQVDVDLDAPPAPEPVHVSEEPTVVREEAERGAEDGAGAAIHIQEPWEGYDRMNVRQVIARLSGASAAELAAVQLYEASRRNRQTVIQAVSRQLRTGAS